MEMKNRVVQVSISESSIGYRGGKRILPLLNYEIKGI